MGKNDYKRVYLATATSILCGPTTIHLQILSKRSYELRKMQRSLERDKHHSEDIAAAGTERQQELVDTMVEGDTL